MDDLTNDCVGLGRFGSCGERAGLYITKPLSRKHGYLVISFALYQIARCEQHRCKCAPASLMPPQISPTLQQRPASPPSCKDRHHPLPPTHPLQTPVPRNIKPASPPSPSHQASRPPTRPSSKRTRNPSPESAAPAPTRARWRRRNSRCRCRRTATSGGRPGRAATRTAAPRGPGRGSGAWR